MFKLIVGGRWSGSVTTKWPPLTLEGQSSLFAEGALGLALAFALCPEVTAHAPQTWAALGILDLCIRPAEVSPSRAPLSTETEKK
jgi:hypothetical protein